MINDGRMVNAGTFTVQEVAWAQLRNTGSFTNRPTGTFVNTNLVNTGRFLNEGRFRNLSGGASSGVSCDGTCTNRGTLETSGPFRVEPTGTFEIAAGGVATVSFPMLNAGAMDLAGRLTLTSSGMLNNTGTLTQRCDGVLLLQGTLLGNPPVLEACP